MTQRFSLRTTWLFFLLIVPIVLWLLPPGFFDDGGIVLCPSRRWFGLPCLGCGMTRAVMHLHHFQWEAALAYNKGVVFAYPALVVAWFVLVKRALREIPTAWEK